MYAYALTDNLKFFGIDVTVLYRNDITIFIVLQTSPLFIFSAVHSISLPIAPLTTATVEARRTYAPSSPTGIV